MGRSQDCYYIVDTDFKNETIYNYLDIKKQKQIEQKLLSTKGKRHLYKNEKDEIFFSYKDSNFAPKIFKKIFMEKHLTFKSVKIIYDF